MFWLAQGPENDFYLVIRKMKFSQFWKILLYKTSILGPCFYVVLLSTYVHIYYLPIYTFFNFFFAEKFKKREIISDFSHNFIIFSKQKLSWFPFLSEQNQNDESLTSISSSHATRNLRFFWRNKPSRAHFESHRK